MDDAMAADEILEIEAGETRWSPPEGTTRHSGTPIDPDADFFADPPPEIGELLTAESTLSSRKRPWKLASRLVLIGLVCWGGAMLIDFLVTFNNQPRGEIYLWDSLFFVFAAPLTWFLTRFRHTCSYVGRLGLARYQCKGNRSRLKAPEVFLFEDAAELRTSQTRHYHNGIYTGTAYAFTWTDEAGKKRFKLSGTYRGEKSPPKPKDPFHLAVMAEGAWSAFLFDRIIAELESNRSARFNLGGRHFVAIGQGFLDVFVSGSEPEHLAAEEIGGIQVADGVIKIKRVDAQEGWFSSTGVYKFNYDQMANSRLFMLLYPRLVGR